MVADRKRGGRLRLPNTRTGAIALAPVLTAVGVTLGMALLVVVPMVRARR